MTIFFVLLLLLEPLTLPSPQLAAPSASAPAPAVLRSARRVMRSANGALLASMVRPPLLLFPSLSVGPAPRPGGAMDVAHADDGQLRCQATSRATRASTPGGPRRPRPAARTGASGRRRRASADGRGRRPCPPSAAPSRGRAPGPRRPRAAASGRSPAAPAGTRARPA